MTALGCLRPFLRLPSELFDSGEERLPLWAEVMLIDFLPNLLEAEPIEAGRSDEFLPLDGSFSHADFAELESEFVFQFPEDFV